MKSASRGVLKVEVIKEYWMILWFILFSGSLYFQVMRIKLTMIIVAVTLIIMFLTGWKIKRNNFNYFIIYSIFFLLNILATFYYGIDINAIILMLLRMFFLIVLQSNTTEGTFKKRYVDIMTFEALLSLACFLYANVLAIGSLPLFHYEQGTVNGYYLTFYYTVGWANYPVFSRNAGWFLEPGMHQIFLNFAILFLLSSKNNCGYSRKKYRVSLAILMVTLLTTQSTTGYMCLLTLICAVMFMNKTDTENINKSLNGLKIMALVALGVLLVVENTTHVIEYKFAGMYTGQSSAATRYYDTITGYKIAFTNPIFGYGFFNTAVTTILKTYGIISISNGMASFLTGSGLLLGVLFLVRTYCGMRKSMPYGTIFNILVFVFYLMCVNSEGGVLSILMYLIFLFEWDNSEKTYG